MGAEAVPKVLAPSWKPITHAGLSCPALKQREGLRLTVTWYVMLC